MESPRHLLEYWAVLKRRRWVVYVAVAVVATTAVVGSFLVTPLYRATSTLQIERQNPDILTFREMAGVDYSFAAYQDFYQTQYRLLSSEAVTERAAGRLRLEEHPLYAAPSRPGLRARLRALLPGTPPSRELSPTEAASARVRGALEIAPVRNSHLVEVSFVGPDPEVAADVANAVVDAYIGFTIESKYTATDQATEFLVTQIATLRREIDEIERILQDYGEAKRIVSVDDASNITLRALADVSSRRTEAETDLARKEAAWRALLAAPDDAVPDVQRSELIARLKQEHALYEGQYTEKSKLFKDGWPELRTIRSKLEQSAERLAIESAAIARAARLAAESEYRRAAAEVANLTDLLLKQERAAQALKRNAVEYTNLQSEVKKKRETLNTLIARQSEMALSTRLKDLEATSTNVRIVDRAKPPVAPFRPNRTLNALLGVVLGLGLGVGMAFFLDYLDSSIASPSESERASGLPTLAVVPRIEGGGEARASGRLGRRLAAVPVGAADLVTRRDPRGPDAEAYRELRTAILLSSAGRPPRRIMVTSALPEEGKSTTALNLAAVLSQLGKRVLLVDADLRRPRLHRALALSADRGATTYLSGLEDALESLVQPTDLEGLDLLASGPVPPNPAELLNSERFASLAEEALSAGYDHVVFDSAPVLSVSDPVLVASASDVSILVVRAHRTPRESVRLAVEKFAQARLRPVGVVLNGLDREAHDYLAYRYYEHRGEEAEGKDGRAEAAR